jgi:hypothetical protein
VEKQKTVVTGVVEDEETQPTQETEKPENATTVDQMTFPFEQVVS